MTGKDRLRQHLETLHRELSGSEQLDEDLRGLLAQVDDDIHRLLEAESQPAPADEEDHALSEQVREAATNFQAEHPRTYRVLREIADTLAKLGI